MRITYFAKEVSKVKGRHYFLISTICYSVGVIRRVIRNRVRAILVFLVDAFAFFHARVLNRPLVHVIGDSHVVVFRGSKQFLAHHIGAATAYNLNKKNNTTKSNEKLFKVIRKLGKRDIVMLCFGEIDCRIHIYYQHKKSNEKYSINDLIDRTVANYGEAMAQLKQRGLSFCIYSVPPATVECDNEYKYPFFGSPEVRCQISRLFNERLKAFCENNGYLFIDVYDKVSDRYDLMLDEYKGDSIHLNRNVVRLVREELKEKMGVDLQGE